MKDNERDWVLWFAGEYRDRTTIDSIQTPAKERVPWVLIEDKGVALGIVPMDRPGWFDALKVRWANLFPTEWCELADAEFKRGGSIDTEAAVYARGQKPPPPRPLPPPLPRSFDRMPVSRPLSRPWEYGSRY